MVKLLKYTVKIVICSMGEEAEAIPAAECRNCPFYEEDDSTYVYCKYPYKTVIQKINNSE